MHIEIDISGQIQQKNLDSALGFRRSNGLTKSIFLKKDIKSRVNQKYKGQVINLVEKLHCILIYYAIKDHLENVKEIKICRDVNKRIVANLLPKLFKQNKYFSKIKIKFISGKNSKSNGHSPAIKAFRHKEMQSISCAKNCRAIFTHKKYASKIITFEMIEDVLFKFK